MEKRTRTILLIGLMTTLFVLTGYLGAGLSVPSGDSSIWFHAGLLMLIFGSYWIEHYFTRPSDVVVNGLIVFIAVSTLQDPPLGDWWLGLRILSALLAVAALIVLWRKRSPAEESAIRRVIYLLVTRAGKAEVLYSLVFVLALLSYFDLATSEARFLTLFWAVVLIARHLDLHLLADLWRKRSPKPEVVGTVSRYFEPHIVRFNVLPNKACKRGALVALCKGSEPGAEDPLAWVIGHRRHLDGIEGEALIVDFSLSEGQIDQRRTVVKADKDEPQFRGRIKSNPLISRSDRLIGFASKETEIGKLRIEICGEHELEEGHLVSVPVRNSEELLFQIVNGRLVEERSIEGGERAFTLGEAEQLGSWNVGRQGFETYGWVVSENSPILAHQLMDSGSKVQQAGLVDVGHVPNSGYSVNIRLSDFVIFHSAILGVTGSGKSFLAFHLIEECKANGIKVLCLDVTGDYKRYLRGPVMLRGHNSVKKFLDRPESGIGVVEFTEERIHPIVAAKNIANIARQWCQENRRDDEVKKPVPKVLLVLEEAHTLVPEWNFNPQRSHQDVVTETAQIVLQARKYGLGFLVITQRTANVTKSILNQCNTIFAFQAYDETGFDFMKNYMGWDYVQALPNLQKRQGIVVGKASTSDRPIIARFHDQDRESTVEDVEEFEVDEP